MMAVIQTANGRYNVSDINLKNQVSVQPIGFKNWLLSVWTGYESENQSKHQPDKNSVIGNQGTTGLAQQTTQSQTSDVLAQNETESEMPPRFEDRSVQRYAHSATNETAPTTEPSTAPWTTQDDTETVYSDTSSLNDTALNLHLSGLADSLVKRTRVFHHFGLDKVLEDLADKLMAFALMIGLNAQSQTNRDIMAFVYKNRQ
jgi:hypothetical protein